MYSKRVAWNYSVVSGAGEGIDPRDVQDCGCQEEGYRMREGCSQGLSGQPSAFLAQGGSDSVFLSTLAFCHHFRYSRRGAWTRWYPGPTSSLTPTHSGLDSSLAS